MPELPVYSSYNFDPAILSIKRRVPDGQELFQPIIKPKL